MDLGSDVKVECSALANPEPSSYTWTRVNSDTWVEEGRWLVLRNVSHEDSGEYTCTASNTLRPTHGVASTRRGRSSTTIAVTHEPGQSHVVPGDTGVREEVAGVEGRRVTMSCVTEPPGEWRMMVVTTVMTVPHSRLPAPDVQVVADRHSIRDTRHSVKPDTPTITTRRPGTILVSGQALSSYLKQ